MNKFWVLLFALVPACALATFVYAAGMVAEGFWLPENISVVGHDIDHLFFVILTITAITFFGVNFALVYFMWKYGVKKAPGKSVYSHGNHKLETIWTIIPAAILAFIAFYQYGTWQDAKFKSNVEGERIHARVLGGQFEWRIRYPHADVNADVNADPADIWRGEELEMVNELHCWKGQKVLLRIQSRDVIHSFYIPATRMKQDLMPGMFKQGMWFEPEQAGEYEIACAELCGWGHYKMKGKLVVHETEQEYDAWYADALRKQRADQEDL